MKQMMKKLLITLAAGLLAVSCVINIGGMSFVGNCTEEGIDYVDTREVAAFKAISTSLPCNVYYSLAEKQEVRVESTEEFAGKVITEVENGTLKLKLEEGRYPKLILRVVVSSPDIERLTVSGSGNIIHEGALHASKDLSLRVSGSGDIQAGDIDSQEFDAVVSGSGRLRIASLACTGFAGHVGGSGSERIDNITCDGLDVSVSGSGHITIDKAKVDGDVKARISGSGRIRLEDVTVDGDMELSSTGSGGMTVNGSCHEVDAVTSGAGSISGNLTHTAIRTHSSGSGHVNL